MKRRARTSFPRLFGGDIHRKRNETTVARTPREGQNEQTTADPLGLRRLTNSRVAFVLLFLAAIPLVVRVATPADVMKQAIALDQLDDPDSAFKDTIEYFTMPHLRQVFFANTD